MKHRKPTTRIPGSRALIDGDLSLIAAVDCNLQNPFASSCSVVPQLSLSAERVLTLAVPEFTPAEIIVAPSSASDAALVYLVVAMDPVTKHESHASMFRIEMGLRDALVPAQEFTTEVLEAAQLVIVASAIFFYRQNNLAGMIALNGKEWHPCEVSTVLRTDKSISQT